MIIPIFLKKIILNLIVFLSFLGITNFAKSEQKPEIISDKLLINEEYSNNFASNKIKLISKNNSENNNNKIINYMIRVPDQINTYSYIEIEEEKDIKYYFAQIINKISELSKNFISGFLGAIGGYFAQIIIYKINNEPKKIY